MVTFRLDRRAGRIFRTQKVIPDCPVALFIMKRNRLQMQSESDDDEVVLSDDEYEELAKDAAAYTGTRYGGRSEKVLQNNIVRTNV